MNWQLFDALGIFLGFTANLVISWTGHLSWRFQLASACIPAGCLMTLILTITESPRWLLKKGKRAEAFDTLCALRPTHLQAAAELFYANAQIQAEVGLFRRDKLSHAKAAACAEAQHVEHTSVESDEELDSNVFQEEWKNTNYWIRIYRLFTNPRSRRAAVAASVVMLSQQLCGV